jgi:hypothetical protein
MLPGRGVERTTAFPVCCETTALLGRGICAVGEGQLSFWLLFVHVL